MRKIVILAWIATGIFGILFIIRLVALSKIQTKYGSAISYPPIVFGTFLGNVLIPGILWIIAAGTASYSNVKSSVNNNIESNNQDPEIKLLKSEINDLAKLKNVLKENYSILKKSYSQGLLDQSKFDFEDTKIRTEFDKLKSEIFNKTNRIKAIELLVEKFRTLDQLYNNGVISISEKEIKREEQIKILISRMN